MLSASLNKTFLSLSLSVYIYIYTYVWLYVYVYVRRPTYRNIYILIHLLYRGVLIGCFYGGRVNIRNEGLPYSISPVAS